MATLENPTYVELSSIIADVADAQNPHLLGLSNIHKELGFAAARHHHAFRDFLLMLDSMNRFYGEAVNAKGIKAVQPDDIFTIDGIIDPVTKKLKQFNYRGVLCCFERTIREFEQTLISAQIELGEYRNRWSERSANRISDRDGGEGSSLWISPSLSGENRGKYYANKLRLEVADETAYLSKNSSIFSDTSNIYPGTTTDARTNKITPRNRQQNLLVSCFGQHEAHTQQQKNRLTDHFSVDITHSNSKEKRLSSESSSVYSRKTCRFKTDQFGIPSGEELPKKVPYITPILKNKGLQGTLPSTDIIGKSFAREYWTSINTKVNSHSQQRVLKNMLQCQKKIDYKPRDLSNKENEEICSRKVGRATASEVINQEESKLRKIFKENRFFVGQANSKFIKLR